MIKIQYPYIDGNNKEIYTLIKHYSDNGHRILQIETGITYNEAIDVYPCKYTYIESEEKIETNND